MLAAVLTIIILATLLGIPAFAGEEDKPPVTDRAAESASYKLKQQTKKLLDEILKVQNDLKDVTVRQTELEKLKESARETAAIKMRRDQDRELSNSEKRLISAQAEADAEEKRLERAREYQAELSDQLDAEQELLARYWEKIAAGKELTKEDDKRYKAAIARRDDIVKAMGVEGAEIKKLVAEQEASNKQAQDKLTLTLKGAKGVESITKAGQGLAKIIGLQARQQDNFSHNLLTSFVNAASLEGGLSEIGKNMMEIVSPGNIFFGLIDKIKESTIAMALAADSAFASFNRTVSTMGTMDDVVLDVRTNTVGLGVSFAEAVEATQELYAGMRDFAGMSEEAQTELAGFSASMGRLGVASQTTATFMNLATKSLNMTTAGAMTAQRELVATAAALGRPIEELVAGFNEAMPQLAKFGNQAFDVFKGLAAAAKVTGLEISQLLGITGQFDTFQGAAEAAGRLNAILGGDLLNSVDLLNASDDERIRMLIQSIELSGRSWEAMGRFERQAVASAAGITDMTAANQLFSQSLSAYDQQQAAAEASAMSQEDMEERARLNTSAQESLKIMFESLAIAIGPIVDGFNLIMKGLLKVNGVLGNVLIPTMFGLIGVFYAFTKIAKISLFLSKLQAFALAIWNLQNIQLVLSTTKLTFAHARLQIVMARTLLVAGVLIAVFMVFKKLGPIAAAIATFAAAWLLYAMAQKMALGKAILIVSILLAIGAAIMASIHSPPLYIGIFILAAGMWALTAASSGAGPPMLIFGLAALMVGAAVALMGLGVWIAAQGIAAMLDSLVSVEPAQLFALAAALVVLALAFMAIGFIMMLPFVSVGLAVFATGLYAIGAAFKDMSLEKIAAFERFTGQMNNMDKNVGLNLEIVGEGIEEIAGSIDDVPVFKSLILAHTMEKMAEVATIATPAAVESAKKMTDVIKEVASIKIGFASVLMWDKAIDNLIRVLKGTTAPAAGAAAAAAGGGGTTVVLELDRRQLGRTVVDLVNERYNLNAS